MATQQRLVIVDGVRTPFCKMGTALAGVPADELGATAVKALVAQTGIDPGSVAEVIMGCCGQPIESANIGRVIALRAGIPAHVPAITVHRNCASGCEVITQAYEKMCAGVGDIFIVGGTESMSNYPLVYRESAVKKFGNLARAKTLGQRIGGLLAFRPGELLNPKIALMIGLTDSVSGLGMGQTAELVGRENGVTREMADTLALQSHKRAAAARPLLAEEITPVFAAPDYKTAVEEDVGPRENQTMEALGKLKTVFERNTGTVTAGNASQLTDGAVALLVVLPQRRNVVPAKIQHGDQRVERVKNSSQPGSAGCVIVVSRPRDLVEGAAEIPDNPCVAQCTHDTRHAKRHRSQVHEPSS